MSSAYIDLSYLNDFCKGDRARMVRYIRLYLETSPGVFAQLKEQIDAGDAETLATVAHSLRPQATYMGARPILDLLTAIEQTARAEGAAACADLVQRLVPLCEKVNDELRAALADRSTGS